MGYCATVSFPEAAGRPSTEGTTVSDRVTLPLPTRPLSQLLQQINADLPPHVDWKSGAATYLQQVFDRDGRENVEPYLLHKPFARFQGDADDHSRGIFFDLLHNFSNVLQLLRLPVGARILDVACGAGWLSQWLMRLGFEMVGIDMSYHLLEYARRRLREDTLLTLPETTIQRAFVQHDLEAAPLPASLGTFDAAIFESCVHHFYNPVSALTHVADALADNGLAVVIEGENRSGPLKPEYVTIMQEFATIERPYSRSELQDVLAYAGLPCVEFFSPVNGWYAPDSGHTTALPEYVRLSSEAANRCVCAKSPQALRRVVPQWATAAERPVIARRGISEGMPGLAWSAPQSELLVRRACTRLTVQLGSHLPDASGALQHITVATSDNTRHHVTLMPGGGTATVELRDLHSDISIHFASNAVFSPAWTGSSDPRVLSFWMSVRDETGAVLIPEQTG